jgi:hypothetical protein
MRKASKVVLSTVVLLLGAVSAVWAADMCFTDVVDGFEANLFVGKGFALPTAGNCKAFSGFFGDSAWLLTGNACGTSNNALIRFSLRYSQFRVSASPGVIAAEPFVYHALAYISRSTGLGQVEYVFDNGGPGGTATGVFPFKKVVCPPLSVRPFE